MKALTIRANQLRANDVYLQGNSRLQVLHVQKDRRYRKLMVTWQDSNPAVNQTDRAGQNSFMDSPPWDRRMTIQRPSKTPVARCTTPRLGQPSKAPRSSSKAPLSSPRAILRARSKMAAKALSGVTLQPGPQATLLQGILLAMQDFDLKVQGLVRKAVEASTPKK